MVSSLLIEKGYAVSGRDFSRFSGLLEVYGRS